MLPAFAESTNEFIPELPQLWMPSLEVRASVGYKDNLLLDHNASEASGFIGSGFDFTLARLPLDGRQVNVLVSADDIRYWSGKQLEHEDLVLAFAQAKVDVGSAWRLGGDVRYLYQDQVVDTSVSEESLSSTLVRGHGLAFLPNVNWSFARNTWVELSGLVQRELYEEPLDDYWEGGPRITLGHDYGHRSSISLSYGWNRRDYDTREQVSLSGTNVFGSTNLPGSHLRFYQHDVELLSRHYWDSGRRWRSLTRLGLQSNQDNGPGYYNYIRYYAGEQLRFAAKGWEAEVKARLAFYPFAHQTVSATDLELRRKAIASVACRGERVIWRELKLFAEYEYEQSFSNLSVDAYRVNKVSGGALWEF